MQTWKPDQLYLKKNQTVMCSLLLKMCQFANLLSLFFVNGYLTIVENFNAAVKFLTVILQTILL